MKAKINVSPRTASRSLFRSDRDFVTFALSGFLLIAIAFMAAGCGEAGDDDSEDTNMIQPIGTTVTSSTLDLSTTELAAANVDLLNLTREQLLVQATTFSPLTADGSTVATLDLDRYVGRWYEIATYEQVFQRGCTGTTATYTPRPDSTITVLNECYVGSLDGLYKKTQAYAKVVDKVTNARLKVFFVPLFGAPYWVIELDGRTGDQPYEWAVVGGPTDDFLWILSRTPQMNPDRLDLILETLVERGYDLEKLSFTPQATP
ncbi:MAG: lipocalin family protein [Candidatus Lernaella stagnicola]|nr:lipocalin family protein [Candidatus Lernaella stagnicola]